MDSASTDLNTEAVRVRLFMPIEAAEALAGLLAMAPRTPDVQRLLDQLWLRTALIEQWRRMRIVERPAFVEQADRVLAALDL
jgi:hypothetical protein